MPDSTHTRKRNSPIPTVKETAMRIIALTVILLLCVVARANADDRPAPRHALKEWKNAQHTHDRLPRNAAFFIAIGRCEQPAPADKRLPSGRWKRGYEWGINWHHPGPSYPGGLGVWAPLWQELNGTAMAPSPDKATPIQQMIHAQRIINRYGVYAWGCTGVALASAPYRR